MVRSAAKNFQSVAVVTDAGDYSADSPRSSSSMAN